MTATVSDLINELKTIGYDLYLEGENLRYRFTALTEPPKERVILLLDTLKRNKGEVAEYLTFKDKPIPFNTLWGMFKDSLKRVDNPFMDDEAWGRIMKTPKYRQVWDRLNDIQLDCMKGRASLGEYQDTLKEWQRVVKELSNVNNCKDSFI
ncbi:MAG: hypothetical protein AABZ11_11575 [Nitrospinota bacterium]